MTEQSKVEKLGSYISRSANNPFIRNAISHIGEDTQIHLYSDEIS